MHTFTRRIVAGYGSLEPVKGVGCSNRLDVRPGGLCLSAYRDINSQFFGGGPLVACGFATKAYVLDAGLCASHLAPGASLM